MKTQFEQLPDHARVWVYQAHRPLSALEVTQLQADLDRRFEHWAAHGQPLTHSVTVRHDRFVVIGVDEARQAASGCSIDASTRILQELGQAYELNFFDRAVCYIYHDDVQAIEPTRVKVAVQVGLIQPDTPVFDATVQTLGALRAAWPRPAADTWLSRYFKTAETVA